MTRHRELTQVGSKRCEHETEDGAAPEIKRKGENEYLRQLKQLTVSQYLIDLARLTKRPPQSVPFMRSGFTFRGNTGGFGQLCIFRL